VTAPAGSVDSLAHATLLENRGWRSSQGPAWFVGEAL